MAKEKDYETLSAQIGDMGGDNTEQAPEAGLGKLQHKSSYGQREDLTQSEEDAKNAFLKRQREMRESNDGGLPQFGPHDPDTPIADGWVPLAREEFGIRSQFYPSGWEFYIRAATSQAIKNWIGIDEKNALQLNHTFDEIIKLCVRIKCGEATIPWSRVNTWDRFWLILKVRELTFASNKKTITFEDNCSECDQDVTFELRASTLHYEFPDEDIVKKYWNAEDMEWNIDPQEYGVEDSEPITLYTPSIAVQQAVIDWAQRQYNRNKKVDETFASTFLPWMINKVPKDDNLVDKQIQKIEKEYRAWSVDMQELMTDVIRNITINPKENLKQVCPHCGEEVVSNVQFPNGIKVLFTPETRIQKFGSR